MKNLFFAFLLLCFSSCGFQPVLIERTSLSLKIIGDQEGVFTSALLAELNAFGYTIDHCAPYSLFLEMKTPKIQHVGFQFDTTGAPCQAIVPNETKLIERVFLSLYYEDIPLICSHSVEFSQTFDHTWLATPNQINLFSLGQLTDYTDAKRFCSSAAKKRLAEEVVMCLNDLIWQSH